MSADSHVICAPCEGVPVQLILRSGKRAAVERASTHLFHWRIVDGQTRESLELSKGPNGLFGCIYALE